MGTRSITSTSECKLKILVHVVFIAQSGHYGKFTALPQLISIGLQLTNQTNKRFSRNHAMRGYLSKIPQDEV